MRKFLSVFSMVFLMLCSRTFGFKEDVTIKAKGRYIVADSPKINIVMPKGYLTEEELWQFIEALERSYHLIQEYLEVEEVDKKIYITLVDGRYISNTTGNRIGLSYVKYDKSPYTHELVHAVTNISIKGKGIPNWLYEGMAIYVNDLYNENGSAPNFGKNIHEMAKERIDKKEYQEVLSFDDKYKWMSAGKEMRRAFYVFSGSLSRYIIENYGKEYFMGLYINEGINWLQGDEGRRIYEEWHNFIEGGK